MDGVIQAANLSLEKTPESRENTAPRPRQIINLQNWMNHQADGFSIRAHGNFVLL